MQSWEDLCIWWGTCNPTIRTVVKVLGLWAIAMVVLLLATPSWFVSWAGHFGLFVTAVIVLLTVAVALNPSDNTRGTRWVGGGLVGVIVAIFLAAVIHKYFFAGDATGARIAIRSPIATPCDPTQGMCRRVLEGGSLLDVVVPQFKSFTVRDCTGNIRYTATWEDAGGLKKSSGGCREINTPGEMYKDVSGIPHDIHVVFVGGQKGGVIFTALE
ncbi:MAG: hypothetical protein ACYC8S_00195 [Minisyncoccota bacterium]